MFWPRFTSLRRRGSAQHTLFVIIFLSLLLARGARGDAPVIDTQIVSLPGTLTGMVWNAASKQVFVGSGNDIYAVNPESAHIDDTIPIGEAYKSFAISSDGQYIYVCASERAVVKRYRVFDHGLDLEVNVGLQPTSAVPLRDKPTAFIVSFGPYAQVPTTVYDNAVQRSVTSASGASSLYVRPSDGAVFGLSGSAVVSFAVDASGISLLHQWPLPSNGCGVNDWIRTPNWSGNFLAMVRGCYFDLNAGGWAGTLSLPQGTETNFPSIAAPNGQFALAITNGERGAALTSYSMTTFRPTASAALTADQASAMGSNKNGAMACAWAGDGYAFGSPANGGSRIAFFRLPALTPVVTQPTPTATVDATGITHVPVGANKLVYDGSRNVLWATIPGSMPQYGNSVLSIHVGTGQLIDWMDAGSEPGSVALTGDATRLYVALNSASAVLSFDLEAKRQLGRYCLTDPSAADPVCLGAVELTTLPGLNTSYAAVTSLGMLSRPYEDEVIVYDGATPRRATWTGWVNRIFPGNGVDTAYGVMQGSGHADGTTDVFRFIIDESGIKLDKQLAPKMTGSSLSSCELAYSSERLFTGGGQLWSASTDRLQGTFAATGIPVTFDDLGQLAYVSANVAGLTSTTTVTIFDRATMRPLASRVLPANALSAVRAGSRTLAVALPTEILLIPLGSMTTWAATTPIVTTPAQGVRAVRVPVNAIAGTRSNPNLFVSLPSTAGSIGNTVGMLNTSTGQIEGAAFVGSEPTLLRASPDGTSAYTYLAGEARFARYNAASRSRDLVFSTDPTGGAEQYSVQDLVVGPGAVMTASLGGGIVATFDNGVPRSKPDNNANGPGAYSYAPYMLALNDDGTRLYGFDGYWSTLDFRRLAITPTGPKWLSGLTDAPIGASFKCAGGLIYSADGTVYDPEHNRVVGTFRAGASLVEPDPAAGRVYFASSYGQISVYDSKTYARIASWSIPGTNLWTYLNVIAMARYGPNGLALLTASKTIYLIQISSIPITTPVPTPQPSLPVTSGVTLVDRAAKDLVYDAERDRIYASAPNSEAANGDQIFSIEPASGKVTASWPTDTNPNLLALTDDRQRLFFTSGSQPYTFYSGYSPYSEHVTPVNLASGEFEQAFPDTSGALSDFSYNFSALVALPGMNSAVATLENVSQVFDAGNGGDAVVTTPSALRIYDNGMARTNFLKPRTFSCQVITPGASASRLYCSSGITVQRLGVDADGVKIDSSFRMLPSLGTFGRMLFLNGRLYTTTGEVIDAERGRVIARLSVQGPVTSDGTTVYWADSSASLTGAYDAQPYVQLRSFDSTSLKALGTRRVNVSKSDVSALIACGHGRVAFRAGNEVYIVNP